MESHILNGPLVHVVVADSGGWWVTFHDLEDLPTVAEGIRAKVQEVAKNFTDILGQVVKAVQPPREAWQEAAASEDGVEAMAARVAAQAEQIGGEAMSAARVMIRRVTCPTPVGVAACLERATAVRTKLLDLVSQPFGVKLGISCHDDDCPMRT